MATTAPEFSSQVRRADGAVVVELAGELDIAGAPQLRDILLDLMISHESRRIVLDLAELRFIDATGLHLLGLAAQRIERSGGDLEVRNLRPPVQKVFESAGLGNWLSGRA
jgi:anti-anti-sigma factor